MTKNGTGIGMKIDVNIISRDPIGVVKDQVRISLHERHEGILKMARQRLR